MLFGSNNKYVDQYGSSITDLIPYKLELLVYMIELGLSIDTFLMFS